MRWIFITSLSFSLAPSLLFSLPLSFLALFFHSFYVYFSLEICHQKQVGIVRGDWYIVKPFNLCEPLEYYVLYFTSYPVYNRIPYKYKWGMIFFLYLHFCFIFFGGVRRVNILLRNISCLATSRVRNDDVPI